MRLVRFKTNSTILDAIEYGKKWYKEFVKKGVSPVLTEKDIQWLKDVELIK